MRASLLLPNPQRRDRDRFLRTSRSLLCTSGIIAAVALGCGEPLPPITVDVGSHDRCDDAVPYAVDASASEIQCFVEEYTYLNWNPTLLEMDPVVEEGFGVPGSPVCCEVCAKKEAADRACEGMCIYDLCERARDEHVSAGNELGTCDPTAGAGCGFAFQDCVDLRALQIQTIDLLAGDDVEYSMRTACEAVAADPVRPDGLFRYLDGLDGVPGAHGALAEVEDVVSYCLDAQGGAAVTSSTSVAATSGGDGADSTGATGSDAGDPEVPPERPGACGPYATERYWVKPTNNFGQWTLASQGIAFDREASYETKVVDGGVSYTLFPCAGAPDTQCLRFDRLSVRLMEPESGLVVSLHLTQNSELIPMSAEGHFDIPQGALPFAVRYTWDGREVFAMASNREGATGQVDVTNRALAMTGLTTVSEDGTVLAALSLYAELSNTQPRTEILHESGQTWNQVSLTAMTFDADMDPIEHHWTIPGVGNWTGEEVEVELPVGRHAVILRAEDVHRSRGVSATWIDVRYPGT
ncbi:hypothetical protein [Paraliomyxa miuraensis]|uniref:hypothetical protein n=1 Tax=Paraliomyxa miuraensis TaxID=376150 RepID=UPI00224E93D1|nr:hypothetical protein [Paraliomyxa miuraensis]MCX4240859.1 hypothetical protein [Paraliomyxa miuraensis]